MYYLAHHGILGQKWGVRRYQNPDGSLTDKGRKRYGISKSYELKMKDNSAYSNAKSSQAMKNDIVSVSRQRKRVSRAQQRNIRYNFDRYIKGNREVFEKQTPEKLRGKKRKNYINSLLQEKVSNINLNAEKAARATRMVYHLTDNGKVTLEFIYNYDKLEHHGVKGQKWGIRRYQNPDGTHTPLGRARDRARDRKRYSDNDKVFVSGKVSYDKPLDDNMKEEIDKIIKANSQILIGDAPGADTRVQEYLAEKGYSNVIVYTTDPTVRNNVGGWEVQTISDGGNTEERLVRRQKDIAMTQQSTRGLAIMPEDDNPDSATSLNVERLKDSGLRVKVYDYKQKKWV